MKKRTQYQKTGLTFGTKKWAEQYAQGKRGLGEKVKVKGRTAFFAK